MLQLLNRGIVVWSLVVFSMTTMPANVGLLPKRVENAAQERIAAGACQTLVFGVVDGDKSGVVAFGKLDNGKAPDGDTVYEIGSVTKTLTAAPSIGRMDGWLRHLQPAIPVNADGHD